MIVAHLLVGELPPAGGGLGISVLHIARLLASTGHVAPVVYATAPTTGAIAADVESAPVRTVWLAPMRARWEEPLTATDASEALLAGERARLDFLLLRNAVRASMATFQHDRHVLVSFYVLRHGFIGQQVAAALGIPHVAAVRGTDFSKGHHDPLSYPSIAHVARTADMVVTCNEEQTAAFHRMAARRVRLVYSSVPGEVSPPPWQPLPGRLALFSDAGYSFKKGTQVLLRTFARLCNDGLPLGLTIAGSDGKREEGYWSRVRSEYGGSHLSGRLSFLPHVARERVYEFLRTSSIYCSATLGEGCSLARSAALSTGIPIVSTRCGELADLASSMSHVWMCEPGDDDGFEAALRAACAAVLDNAVKVDAAALAAVRALFRPDRERADWLAVLSDLP